VQATIQTKEDYTSKHIDEVEEYLGLLQAKRATIQHQVTEAEEQLSMVWEALDSDGIAEVSLSDNESSSASSPPQSSDYMCPEGLGSDVESNTETSTSYNSEYGFHETPNTSTTNLMKALDGGDRMGLFGAGTRKDNLPLMQTYLLMARVSGFME
jgi:hypothetical protein